MEEEALARLVFGGSNKKIDKVIEFLLFFF
jgi:hypothetical protein